MLIDRLANLGRTIRKAEQAYGRPQGSVALLAVSKTKPPSDITAAYQAGLRHFGENYVQEALGKMPQLGHYDICWHFIGPIQANKTKLIAQHFSWVHSVDSVKVARRLNEQRPGHLPPLNVCLQINISAEPSKSGIALADLPEIYSEVNMLKNIRVRGVMAIPAPETVFSKQREPYRRLMEFVKNMPGINWDTFSFGMSGDLAAAIAEGATIVRIGTALFGTR